MALQGTGRRSRPRTPLKRHANQDLPRGQPPVELRQPSGYGRIEHSNHRGEILHVSR